MILAAASDDVAIAFLEPGLVAFGTPDAVRRSIDARASGASISDNDEVMRLVRGDATPEAAS